MKKGLLTLLTLLYSIYLFSTTCITGGAPFTSQAEINAFAAMNCDTIDYIILDAENASDPITDLSPLNGIKVVTVFIQIAGTTQLVSLNGLETLLEAPDLFIDNNQALVNINALSELQIPGEIVITTNPNLVQCCAIKSEIPTATVTIDKSNGLGCDEISAVLQDTSCDPNPVPTLGEWALIQLFLLFSIVGVVGLQSRRVIYQSEKV